MIARVLCMALLAVAVSASGATAQGRKPAKPKTAYEICIEKARMVDRAMAICGNEETARRDRQVNAVYKQLLAKSEEPAKSFLVKSQRDYLAFRESRCDYFAAEWGGTEAYLLASDCSSRMTEERLKELNEFWEIVRDREPAR